MRRSPPFSTLFPYTTLFRSDDWLPHQGRHDCHLHFQVEVDPVRDLIDSRAHKADFRLSLDRPAYHDPDWKHRPPTGKDPHARQLAQGHRKLLGLLVAERLQDRSDGLRDHLIDPA